MNFEKTIELHEQVVRDLKSNCMMELEKIAKICRKTLTDGGKILLCGNGGSAADSQHIAAEFVGRFVKERQGLPAIAFTTDTSILTAVGNDYGYDEVFRRQVEALGRENDVLIGISTSGNSLNIVKAFEQANKQKMKTIALTGRKESKMSELADVTLKVPTSITARVQECHIMVGHMICEYIDEEY